MQLRSEIQLQSMIKAMKDVVIPAMDSNNTLALEQAQLIVGMMGLMQYQLPVQYRFDRDELTRLIDVLYGLRVLCDLDPAIAHLPERYKGLLTDARRLVDHSGVDPAELRDGVRKIRHVIGEVVCLARDCAHPDIVTRVEKEVLALSEAQLKRDRALVAAQGWEPDPDSLPDIHALLNLEDKE